MIQPLSSQGPRIQRPTILIAGDTPIIRENVQKPLEQHSIQVIITNDALQALSLIADETPDLVLLNEKLPMWDGYHVCRVLRKNLHFQELPILVMRDTQNIFDSLREWLSGTTASLTLPINTDELIQTVKKYLN